MNPWASIGIGAGLIAAVGYAVKMNRTSAELVTNTKAKIHSIDLTGLTIRADITLKNPTKGSFSIKYPFVKLIYKESTIGSSQSINKDILVPAFGEAKIEQIMIKIPLLGLFSVAGQLVKSLTDGSAVKIGIKTITTIDLGFRSIPFEKDEEITLKK